MPLVLLQYKPELKGVAKKLAHELPYIVASNLTLSKRKRHDGQVAPEDIMIWCSERGKADVNGKGLEIIIFAHDYPKRKKNLEARKDQIVACVRKRLIVHNSYSTGIGCVWVLLMPTAYGEL
jgi:hypothetical protein